MGFVFLTTFGEFLTLPGPVEITVENLFVMKNGLRSVSELEFENKKKCLIVGKFINVLCFIFFDR